MADVVAKLQYGVKIVASLKLTASRQNIYIAAMYAGHSVHTYILVTLLCAHVATHTHTHTHTHTRTHARTHAHTHTHVCIYMFTITTLNSEFSFYS